MHVPMSINFAGVLCHYDTTTGQGSHFTESGQLD